MNGKTTSRTRFIPYLLINTMGNLRKVIIKSYKVSFVYVSALIPQSDPLHSVCCWQSSNKVMFVIRLND